METLSSDEWTVSSEMDGKNSQPMIIRQKLDRPGGESRPPKTQFLNHLLSQI